MKPPTVEAVAVAAEVRGHHHASVALNRRIPQLFVANPVVSKAFFRPLANLNCAVKVAADKPVSLPVIDFVYLRL
jgi:hypothetical protein